MDRFILVKGVSSRKLNDHEDVTSCQTCFYLVFHVVCVKSDWLYKIL